MRLSVRLTLGDDDAGVVRRRRGRSARLLQRRTRRGAGQHPASRRPDQGAHRRGRSAAAHRAQRNRRRPNLSGASRHRTGALERRHRSGGGFFRGEMASPSRRSLRRPDERPSWACCAIVSSASPTAAANWFGSTARVPIAILVSFRRRSWNAGARRSSFVAASRCPTAKSICRGPGPTPPKATTTPCRCRWRPSPRRS